MTDSHNYMDCEYDKRQLEERLALHELIRIGYGRGEDLALLSTVRKFVCERVYAGARARAYLCLFWRAFQGFHLPHYATRTYRPALLVRQRHSPHESMILVNLQLFLV